MSFFFDIIIIVWSDLHTSVPPAQCNYIWLLPDPQCMEDMFVLRAGVVYLVGQLLLLFVQVWQS